MELRSLALPLAGLLLLLACDSGTSPVAPADTLFSVTADPLRIRPDESSEIRALALDPSGVPVRTGTEVRFTTTLGRVEPEVATTDRDGVARATLRADGRTGTATVTASSGADSTDSVTVTIDVPKVKASFTPTPSGLTVKFTDESTGNPTSWSWEFGDGEASDERNPLHEYRRAGSYRVFLTVANAEASDSTSQLLAIGAVASFETEPDPPKGLEVQFKDTSQPVPIAWKWKFGDGGTSSLQHPIHTYARSDEYRVRLEVTTENSGKDKTSKVIRVKEELPDPPVAAFNIPPNSDRNGLTIIFRDGSGSSGGGKPTSWKWEFGDGKSSTEQDPIHTYSVAGTYAVTLTVANAAGSDSVTKFVEVL